MPRRFQQNDHSYNTHSNQTLPKNVSFETKTQKQISDGVLNSSESHSTFYNSYSTSYSPRLELFQNRSYKIPVHQKYEDSQAFSPYLSNFHILSPPAIATSYIVFPKNQVPSHYLATDKNYTISSATDKKKKLKMSRIPSISVSENNYSQTKLQQKQPLLSTTQSIVNFPFEAIVSITQDKLYDENKRAITSNEFQKIQDTNILSKTSANYPLDVAMYDGDKYKLKNKSRNSSMDKG